MFNFEKAKQYLDKALECFARIDHCRGMYITLKDLHDVQRHYNIKCMKNLQKKNTGESLGFHSSEIDNSSVSQYSSYVTKQTEFKDDITVEKDLHEKHLKYHKRFVHMQKMMENVDVANLTDEDRLTAQICCADREEAGHDDNFSLDLELVLTSENFKIEERIMNLGLDLKHMATEDNEVNRNKSLIGTDEDEDEFRRVTGTNGIENLMQTGDKKELEIVKENSMSDQMPMGSVIASENQSEDPRYAKLESLPLKQHLPGFEKGQTISVLGADSIDNDHSPTLKTVNIKKPV